MATDQADGAAASSEANDLAPDPQRRTLVVGGSVLALIAVGWFVLSHVVLGTDSVDALVEALGVVLGLLIAASVVGAVWANRRD
jgi:hypothetical protein